MDIPHWISVQRSPHAFNTNDFKLLVLLVTLLGSIYNKYPAIISFLSGQNELIIINGHTCNTKDATAIYKVEHNDDRPK